MSFYRTAYTNVSLRILNTTTPRVARCAIMKIKVLSRNPHDYVRERTSDVHRLPRNLDPKLHPMEAPREYVRALNATKLERVFAKPFLGALSGHADGVYCLCKHPTRLRTVLSGACDGVVKVWDLARLECTASALAHRGFVRGLCCDSRGEHFISVGEDMAIKTWLLGRLPAGNSPTLCGCVVAVSSTWPSQC